ncbi:MAG: PadR family transcriptional regulator [Thermoanaerobaculia bacterium]|nr:PadR family transcriptional regulator [Thermoanaerobaculia bacterium]
MQLKKPKPNRLSEFELLVVLAIHRLGSEAYGAEMGREIESRTGREVALGAIYKTLDRLESRRLLTYEISAPRAERGGRRRKHYRTTALGDQALQRTLHELDAMRTGTDYSSEPLRAQ